MVARRLGRGLEGLPGPDVLEALAECGFVTFDDQVLEAKRQGIDPDPAGDVVKVRL